MISCGLRAVKPVYNTNAQNVCFPFAKRPGWRRFAYTLTAQPSERVAMIVLLVTAEDQHCRTGVCGFGYEIDAWNVTVSAYMSHYFRCSREPPRAVRETGAGVWCKNRLVCEEIETAAESSGYECLD